MRRRLSSRGMIEEVVGWGCRNRVPVCNKDDRAFKSNTLVIDDAWEVGLHDDVAVGCIDHHLHRGPGIWMDENLLEEVKAGLPAVSPALRSDTF